MKRFILFSVLCPLLSLTQAVAQEAYAVFYDINIGPTLTFYYDDLKASRTGTKYDVQDTGNRVPGRYAFTGSYAFAIRRPLSQGSSTGEQ